MSKLDRFSLFMSYIYILVVLFFTQISSNNNFRRLAMGNRSQNNNEPIDLETFARNLRNARKDAGLSQEDVVAKTGLSQAFISGVETGENVSIKNASRLARAVGATLRDLLDPQRK